MNRPRQPGRRFVYQFSDGKTRVVARLNKRETFARLSWNQKMPPGLMAEYENWRDRTLNQLSPGGRWLDMWP